MYGRSLWRAIRVTSIALVIVGALIAAPMSAPVAKAATPPVFYTKAENQTAGDQTSLTINKPLGTAEGDLLIAILAKDGTGPITTPSGWTVIDEGQSGGNPIDDIRLGVFYKVAGSSEPDDYTISWTGSEEAVGAILRYSGADTSDPIDVSNYDTGVSTSPTAPTVWKNANNTLVLRIYGADGDGLELSDPYPSTHNGRFNSRSGVGSGNVCGGAADKWQIAGGWTGTAAFSLNTTQSEKWRAVTVAIQPPCVTYYRDDDNDGYGQAADSQCLWAPSGSYTAAQGGDCDDSRDLVYPGANEICDDLDNDCDGSVDEGCPCTPQATRPCYPGPAGTEGVGLCRAGTQTCNDQGQWGTCTGAVVPTTEIDDDLDNDCDGQVDEGFEQVVEFVPEWGSLALLASALAPLAGYGYARIRRRH